MIDFYAFQKRFVFLVIKVWRRVVPISRNLIRHIICSKALSISLFFKIEKLTRIFKNSRRENFTKKTWTASRLNHTIFKVIILVSSCVSTKKCVPKMLVSRFLILSLFSSASIYCIQWTLTNLTIWHWDEKKPLGNGSVVCAPLLLCQMMHKKDALSRWKMFPFVSLVLSLVFNYLWNLHSEIRQIFDMKQSVTTMQWTFLKDIRHPCKIIVMLDNYVEWFGQIYILCTLEKFIQVFVKDYLVFWTNLFEDMKKSETRMETEILQSCQTGLSHSLLEDCHVGES